jgi:hypothetical protein
LVPTAHAPEVEPFGIWQHPPVQGEEVLQATLQMPPGMLQLPDPPAQSLSKPHPQNPPPVNTRMHRGPVLALAQSEQTPPVAPHADGIAPGVHKPAVFEEQQPE